MNGIRKRKGRCCNLIVAPQWRRRKSRTGAPAATAVLCLFGLCLRQLERASNPNSALCAWVGKDHPMAVLYDTLTRVVHATRIE